MRRCAVRTAGFVLLAASLCLVAGAALGAGGTGKRPLPVKAAKTATAAVRPSGHAEALKILGGKKPSTYYKMSKAAPLEFLVNGPCTFRLRARVLLGQGSADSTQRLRLELDGKQAGLFKVRTGASKKASLEGGAKVGLTSKAALVLPAGKHKIRVDLLKDGPGMAVKALRGIAKKKTGHLIPFAPEIYERVLRLHSKDSESTAYRFTSEKPVELTLHGPVALRMHTRLDFGQGNGVTQSYVIQVRLDGNVWKSYSLKSRASHVATYPEMPEITPGMTRSFELSVPSGSHRLNLALAGATAAGATVQIQIPSPARRIVAGS
jgi:hypothetical protein